MLLAGGCKGEGIADLAGACGPPDSVDVVIGYDRNIEIDDVGQRRDVDSARRDIRGNQHLDAPVFESGECGLTLRLAAVAVDAVARDSGALQLLRGGSRGAWCG